MGNLKKFNTYAEYLVARAAGLLVPPSVSLANGRIYYQKNSITENIGIRANTGELYTLEEFQALSAADKPDYAFVYLFDDTSGNAFVIHNDTGSYSWGMQGTSVPGVSSSQTAMDGFSNTDAVFAYKADHPEASFPAFEFARSRDFIDSSMKGYMGSKAEVELIRTNLADVNLCRAALGHSQIVFQGAYVWSSTQIGAPYAWYWYGSSWYDRSYKSNSGQVLPLAAF